MKKLLIALLILWPALLAAQDETLAPSGDEEDAQWEVGDSGASSCDGAQCNAAACDDEVDETGAADGNIVVSVTDGAQIYFDFPTPSTAPSTTASAQAFNIIMSECGYNVDTGSQCLESNGTDPTFDVNLFCNGSSVSSLASGISTGGLDQSFSYNWTFSTGSCASDGSDVQIAITSNTSGGAPGNRRVACIEKVEWDVTWGAAASSRRTMVSPGGGE